MHLLYSKRSTLSASLYKKVTNIKLFLALITLTSIDVIILATFTFLTSNPEKASIVTSGDLIKVDSTVCTQDGHFQTFALLCYKFAMVVVGVYYSRVTKGLPTPDTDESKSIMESTVEAVFGFTMYATVYFTFNKNSEIYTIGTFVKTFVITTISISGCCKMPANREGGAKMATAGSECAHDVASVL